MPLGWPFVPIDITPDPTPEERAAIVQALAALQANRRRPRGPWWHGGVHEAVGLDEDDPERDRASYSSRS